jgi:hypothetical protein
MPSLARAAALQLPIPDHLQRRRRDKPCLKYRARRPTRGSTGRVIGRVWLTLPIPKLLNHQEISKALRTGRAIGAASFRAVKGLPRHDRPQHQKRPVAG